MGNEYDEALEPLRSTLAADGYLLEVGPVSAAGELTVTVKAGADACPTCLVPVDLFASLAERYLAGRGLHPNVTVVYPEGGAEGICPV